MPCLDAETVLQLLGRQLPRAARVRALRHAEGCDPCRALLATMARDARTGGADAGVLARPARPERPSTAAEVISGYTLGALLGAGGVGTVYRAVPQSGAAPVALKWIAGHRCDAGMRARLAREARATLDLRHPNIVRVLDVGETADGGLLLAMELLEGEDLGARLARGRLDVAEVVRIGRQAAAGLGAAHAAGLVHRDVKPSNLFLCADGAVKVLDFGLALPLDPAHTRLTATDLVVGTPAFMAVEQALATKDEDERTDVWGLGATLYCAVAGRPPFEARSTAAQLLRIVSEKPDPLPHDVPRWLGRVLLRALKKDKASRHPTMSALAEALSPPP